MPSPIVWLMKIDSTANAKFVKKGGTHEEDCAAVAAVEHSVMLTEA